MDYLYYHDIFGRPWPMRLESYVTNAPPQIKAFAGEQRCLIGSTFSLHWITTFVPNAIPVKKQCWIWSEKLENMWKHTNSRIPSFSKFNEKKKSKHDSLSAEHLEARTLHVVGVSAVALEASLPESRTGRLPHNFPPWLEIAGRWVIWVIWVAGVGWLWIWQTLTVALDVRSNAGSDMAWLLLMPGCGFWFFWCYCDWSILGLIHITIIQHVYLTIMLSAKIGKLLYILLKSIVVYWTTDSSWKNAALAVLHPNSSSV